jgi:hypothetical protein
MAHATAISHRRQREDLVRAVAMHERCTDRGDGGSGRDGFATDRSAWWPYTDPVRTRSVPENPPGTLGLRRDPALVPLSQDHHAALMQAQALTRAASGIAPYTGPPERTARGFLAFRQSELLGHFGDEEGALFPAAERVDPEGTARVRSEHAELHALSRGLEEALDNGSDPRPIMAKLGSLLHDHVRFEERAWFEALQTRLSEDDLARLGRALESRRAARGRGPGCALPPSR